MRYFRFHFHSHISRFVPSRRACVRERLSNPELLRLATPLRITRGPFTGMSRKMFHMHGEIKRGRCETSRRAHVRVSAAENTADRIAPCHANHPDFY